MRATTVGRIATVISREHAVGLRTARQAEGRLTEVPWSANKAIASSSSKAQTKAALSCYECEGIGHFTKDCPTRLKREQGNCQQPGRKKPDRAFKTFRVSRRKE